MSTRFIDKNLNNFLDRLLDLLINHFHLNIIENKSNQQYKDINIDKNKDDKTRSIFISNKLETLEIIDLNDINVKSYITSNVTFKRLTSNDEKDNEDVKVFILYYTI